MNPHSGRADALLLLFYGDICLTGRTDFQCRTDGNFVPLPINRTKNFPDEASGLRLSCQQRMSTLQRNHAVTAQGNCFTHFPSSIFVDWFYRSFRIHEFRYRTENVEVTEILMEVKIAPAYSAIIAFLVLRRV